MVLCHKCGSNDHWPSNCSISDEEYEAQLAAATASTPTQESSLQEKTPCTHNGVLFRKEYGNIVKIQGQKYREVKYICPLCDDVVTVEYK